MARFDWYSATLSSHLAAPVVVDALLADLEGADVVEEVAGRGGYRCGHLVKSKDGDTLATVLSGGNGNPHLIGSGERAPAFAAAVRRSYADAHRVTRADTCVDLPADFAQLHPRLQAFAKQRGLKGRTIVPDNPQDGATYYIGAATSPNRVRVYEKGKELAAKGEHVSAADMALVRLEAQIRPVREGRTLAATLTPAQLWGASPWLRDFAQAFIGEDPGRFEMQHRLQTTFDRRCDALVHQWATHLVEWQGRAGSWEALGRVIGDRVRSQLES